MKSSRFSPELAQNPNPSMARSSLASCRSRLLHCLHVVLQHREDSVYEELNPRMKAAVRWVSLPEMTATLLERTHAVLSALDSANLTKSLEAFEP